MSNQNINQVYQSIIAKLSGVRQTWRWLIFSDSFLKWITTLALVMTVILLCFQLPLHSLIRSSIVILSIGVAIYITFRILIRPLLRKLPHSTVAAYLEKAYPNIENRILSTVQLKTDFRKQSIGICTRIR